MRGFVLQDWVTIRGATTLITVNQSESDWLSLEAYQDAFFVTQLSELTLSGGTVTLSLETAPIKDETLFMAMNGTGISLTAGMVGVNQKLSVILSAIGSSVPLSRWVRWRLIPSGSFTAAWDVTFRIVVSCNQIFATGMGVAGSGFGNGGGWPPMQR
jgi:hypothetical protein